MSEKRGLDTALLPTLSRDDLAHTLEMTPVRVQFLEDTVAQNPRSTIVPESEHLDSVGRRAVEGLGEARANHIAEGLSIGGTIGEGGMGLVRLATQRSLGRSVAVKTLKPEARNERATLRLLREAWVTGALEHPNIGPVYDLGLGEDGSPIIVLKLIEGSPWSEVVNVTKDGEDILEQNLRIFVQVCNAVSLAHSRGVIHRDLKLENVMIGRYGEVYLVDWGIAVSLFPDPTGRLPLASEASEMAGTPAYMAPEMLGGVGTKLSERTDVYLLGSILYELLVGNPPHAGDNLRAIMASIVASKITLPPSVPRDLAAIVMRASAREPEQRYGSAEELRHRVEWYLRHRGSLALSDAASLRVKEMHVALEGEGDPDDVRDRIHHLFAEVRFGFRHAVLASHDNDVAKVGLRYATRLVVEYELDHGTAEAAAAALAELDEAPEDLATRVATAMKAREVGKRRVAELEKLSSELDPTVGQRTRLVVGLIVGGVWAINPEVLGWYFRQHPETTYRFLYVTTTVTAVFAWLVGQWGRESLFKTAVNRRTLAVVLTMFASQLMLELGSKLMGLSWAVALPLHVFAWFGSMVAYSLLIDRAFWVSTVFFGIAFVWSAAHPPHVFHAMTIATLTLVVTFMIAWMKPREVAKFLVQRVKDRHTQIRDSVHSARNARDE